VSRDRYARVVALRRAARARLPADALAAAWRRGYWLAAGLLVLGGVLAMGRPFVRRHGLDAPLPHTDTVILEYVGWFVARGNTLYLDIWEIKPPLAFLPPYLFAGLTGGNLYALHLLGIATTALAMALTAAFAARVVGTLTDAPLAGLAVGVAFFALPDLLYRPWLGYKAKILVFALGLAGVDRALHERWGTSGLLAGLAVGVWQLGVLFPFVTTGYALRTRSREALKRHLLGGGVALAAILVAVLLYADPEGFLAQVVLGPLALQSERGAFDPGTYVLFFPGDTGYWATALGAGGVALAFVREEYAPARPLALGGLLMGLIVVFVDFDGLWDVTGPLVFLAAGVGLVVGTLPRRARLAVVVALGLTLAPAFAPSAFVRHDPMAPTETDRLPPSTASERERLYWSGQPIESCRFFGSRTQRSLLDYYPDADRLAAAPCGDAEPYWRALRERLTGGGPTNETAASSSLISPSPLTAATSATALHTRPTTNPPRHESRLL
jgi:hypothetical protein